MVSFRSLTLGSLAFLVSVSAAPAPVPAEVAIIPGVLSLDPNILTGGLALVNANLFATILGPAQCSNNAVVGIKLSISVLPLLNVCACVNVGGLANLGSASCPTCPANADPICVSANCACQCRLGFFAYKGANGKLACAPNVGCSRPNTLIQLLTGQSSCVCARGYVSDLFGGCINACLVI